MLSSAVGFNAKIMKKRLSEEDSNLSLSGVLFC